MAEKAKSSPKIKGYVKNAYTFLGYNDDEWNKMNHFKFVRNIGVHITPSPQEATAAVNWLPEKDVNGALR